MNNRPKLKILIIHNIITPYRTYLFEALAADPNITLTVLYTNKSYKERKWDANLSKIFDNRILRGYVIQLGHIKIGINPEIIRYLIINKPDVIIIGGIAEITNQIALIISKIIRVPILLWSEGIGSSRTKLSRLLSIYIDNLILCCDGVIVPGTASQDYHISIGVKKEIIFISPDIINNDFYYVNRPKNKHEKEILKEKMGFKEKNIILFVGQLIPRKCPEILLEAFQIFNRENTILIFIGDGHLRPSLEKKVGSSKNIIFTGWISEEEKRDYYHSADLFILPTKEDVWGLVINEAMASGLPVITTRLAGASFDMIEDDKNGFVMSRPDLHQLINILRYMFNNSDRLMEMGEKIC